MAAEMKILNEVADVSIDEDFHLDFKDDGEFSLITFMTNGKTEHY